MALRSDFQDGVDLITLLSNHPSIANWDTFSTSGGRRVALSTSTVDAVDASAGLRLLAACRASRTERYGPSAVGSHAFPQLSHITRPIIPVSSTDQRNSSLIGEHLVSSIGRCWGAAVF
jgi:hypothetical protein